MTRQIPLPLHIPPNYSRETFHVYPCNAAAWALVEQYPNWSQHGALIIGEKGAGKTHLASVWQEKADAVPFVALDAEARPYPNVVVDDAEAVDETSLFHALNQAKEHVRSLLITATTPPEKWARLPDLRSRLKSLPTAQLLPPDDEAFCAILAHQCHTQGMEVPPEALAYLAARIDRGFASAHYWAQRIHMESLAQKRGVTIPFLSLLLHETVT